jgi:hypothetical protein
MNDEKQAIIEVIENYILATKSGDVELLKKVFSEKAMMSGDLPHIKLIVESPEHFFNDIKGKQVSKEYKSEICDVSVYGEIAIGLLKEYNLHGLNFVNHYHLQKIEGDWKIVNKLFSVV